MKRTPPVRLAAAVLLAFATSVHARIYDSFNSAANWDLATGTASGGTSVISGGQLTLATPQDTVCTATATLTSNQVLSGTRQSILTRSHSGVANHTVFFLWAVDPTTGNKLELKINDQTSSTFTAGYLDGGGATYHFLGSTAYPGGAQYMAFREASGTVYWEVSSDASTWTTVATLATPSWIASKSLTFKVQHKEYATPTAATSTVVDCFNYKANPGSYAKIEDKTYTYNSAADGWHLYTEAFCSSCGYVDCNNSSIADHYACQASDGSSTCNFQSPNFDCTQDHDNCLSHIFLNCVDSSQHATDGSWINFQMSTDRLTSSETSKWYMNMYRYQNLGYVTADTWTYHLYFKFDNQDPNALVLQGLEFPTNKYSGSRRIQGALAIYPIRPLVAGSVPGSYKAQFKVWARTTNSDGTVTNKWIALPSSIPNVDLLPSSPSDTSHGFYEVKYTVSLDSTANTVSYYGFDFGYAGNTTHYDFEATYDTPTSSAGQKISPAFQIDENNNAASTLQNVWVEGWDINWEDFKLP